MNELKCKTAIKEEIEKRKLKRNKDIQELYLSNKKLDSVIDLKDFVNLQILWLNGNLLRRLTCIPHNERISELYLQDNRLDSIEGALSHLTSLKVLFLQNNQLRKLADCVKEFSKMQTLKNLSNLGRQLPDLCIFDFICSPDLFHNPLAQDPEYRLFIFRLPSVQLLDRQEVLRCERIQSTAQYDEKNELVRNNIAFGRRSEGPPSICYPRPLANPLCTDPVDFEFGNNYYRNNPPFETENEAVTLRAVNRSIMEYTALDWSKVPRGQQRRLAAQDYNSPQTITTRFR